MTFLPAPPLDPTPDDLELALLAELALTDRRLAKSVTCTIAQRQVEVAYVDALERFEA